MNALLPYRLILSICLVSAWITGVRGADKETRIFNVRIDDQPAGQFTICQENDGQGRETMTAETHVSFKKYFLTYRYDLRTSEEWNQGKLVRLQADANDDGTKTSVRVNEPGQVLANGTRKKLPTAALTVTGWRLPPAVEKIPHFSALDVETGEVLPVQITFLGHVQVSVANQTINGRRYRMVGKDVDAELWFDAAGKLIGSIRQEDGHRVTMTLTSIRL